MESAKSTIRGDLQRLAEIVKPSVRSHGVRLAIRLDLSVATA